MGVASEPAAGGADSLGSKGAISQLQEYVQEVASLFRMPANCSVLQWDIATRLAGSGIEFRATVAFLLDGVPHHIAGVWRQSKKLAQRDAAERALELYTGPRPEARDLVPEKVAVAEEPSGLGVAAELREEQPWFVATTSVDVAWSVPIPATLISPPVRVDARRPQAPPLLQPGPVAEDIRASACAASPDTPPPWPKIAAPEPCLASDVPVPQRLSALAVPADVQPSRSPGLDALEDTQSEDTHREEESEVDLLKEYCSDMGWPAPRFSFKLEGDCCLAMVEIELVGVHHTFSGQMCYGQEAAEADVARRVLWYLQVPGREDAFEPDEDYARKAAQVIPEPPKADWVKDGALQDDLVERRMTVMLVQNRLQQAFARQVGTGDRVWHWSYERGPRTPGVPPMFRATVHVPLAGRCFVGDWVQGQREAQIDTCAQVVEFLDQEYPRGMN